MRDVLVAELARGARARRDDDEGQILASLAASRESLNDLGWEMLEQIRQVAEGVDLALAEEEVEVLDRRARKGLIFLVPPGWPPAPISHDYLSGGSSGR